MDYPIRGLDRQTPPFLPLEIVLHIIECLRPERNNTVLPPSHEITKTLLSARLVCHAVNSTAVKILHQHAMYIGTNEQAQVLSANLMDSTLKPGISNAFKSLWSDFDTVTNLVLSLFPYPDEDEGTHKRPAAQITANQVQRDNLDDESDSQSDAEIISPLNDMPTALALRDILLTAVPSLRSLVINIPLRSLYPEDDHHFVRPIIRQGFEGLTNLEEFCSIQDELYLDVFHGQDPVWADYWPKLRRLQLYNPMIDADSGIWTHMARLPSLETVVFVRADPGDLDMLNLKEMWLDAVNAEVSRPNGVQTARSKNITIIMVNVPPSQPDYAHFKENWRALDPDGNARVLLKDVPVPKKYRKSKREWKWSLDPIVTTQDCVLGWAADGVLWDDEDGRREVA